MGRSKTVPVDAAEDVLDAVLCAVQATWAWMTCELPDPAVPRALIPVVRAFDPISYAWCPIAKQGNPGSTASARLKFLHDRYEVAKRSPH